MSRCITVPLKSKNCLNNTKDPLKRFPHSTVVWERKSRFKASRALSSRTTVLCTFKNEGKKTFRIISYVLHNIVTIQVTFAISGSEAIRLTNLVIALTPSNRPSSILISRICAPFSTWSLATVKASLI